MQPPKQTECQHCAIPLSGIDTQYVFKMGDQFFSLHTLCAEELIDIYKVSWDGNLLHITANVETVLDYVKELVNGDKIEIRKNKMPRIKYLMTPEL